MSGASKRVLWRAFLNTFVCCLGLAIGAAGGLNALLLYRAGETWSYPAILQWQQRTGALYRPGTNNDIMTPRFRFTRYDALQPEIVALGSSRVLQFRQRDFTRPFVAMASIASLAAMPRMAQALIEKPNHLKFVILAVEFEHLNGAVPLPHVASDWDPRAKFSGGISSVREALVSQLGVYVTGAWRLIRNGRVTFRDLWTVLCRCNEWGPVQELGIAAMVDGSGVDVEGSYHDRWVYSRPSPDPSFAQQYKFLDAGQGHYVPAPSVDESRWATLLAARKILTDAGIQVVVIVPPVAPGIAAKMETSGRYGSIPDLERRLASVAPSFFFHDPTQIGSNDCEFIDAVHGGEIVYDRMLERMAGENGIRRYVNLHHVRDAIATSAGHVLLRTDLSNGRAHAEPDFLQLGCVK